MEIKGVDMGSGLEDLEVLKEAEKVADEIWDLTARWDRLAREVVGVQLARAADSVGANIAEAFGRFHYFDKIRFLYYARGSLFETRFWLNRAAHRQLMHGPQAEDLHQRLARIARQLNAFVRILKAQSHSARGAARSIREPPTADYSTSTGPDRGPFVPEDTA